MLKIFTPKMKENVNLITWSSLSNDAAQSMGKCVDILVHGDALRGLRTITNGVMVCYKAVAHLPAVLVCFEDKNVWH